MPELYPRGYNPEMPVPIVAESVQVVAWRRVGGKVRYLLLKRTKKRGGFWQPVTGRIEAGERADEAARREFREETGLEVRRMSAIDHVGVYYYEPDGKLHLEPAFAAEVERAEVRLSKEHVKSRWVGRREALRLLKWENNRQALRALAGSLSGV